MRIGIAQINTVPGAFDATVERMVAQSQRAAEQNVDLLLFPLAALAGVDVLPFADTPSFMRDIAEAMVSLSERVACPCIVPVPMAYAGEEAEFDAVLLDGGDMRPLCLMSHLRPEDTHEVRDDHEVPQFEFSGERVSIALSYESLDNCVKAYDKLIKRISSLSKEGEVNSAKAEELIGKFKEAMDNDLNTSLGLTVVYDVLKADANDATKRYVLGELDRVLSLNLLAEKEEAPKESNPQDAEIDALIAKRTEARKNKDWATADAIRDQLAAMKVVVVDTKDGISWHYAD